MIKDDIKNKRIAIESKINQFVIQYGVDYSKLVDDELNKLIEYIRNEAMVNE